MEVWRVHSWWWKELPDSVFSEARALCVQNNTWDIWILVHSAVKPIAMLIVGLASPRTTETSLKAGLETIHELRVHNIPIFFVVLGVLGRLPAPPNPPAVTLQSLLLPLSS